MAEAVSVAALFAVVALFFGIGFWALRVIFKQQKVFREFLMQEGFAKVSQPQAINEESLVASPVLPPQFEVLEAWERDSSLGRLRLLFIYGPTRSEGGRKRRVALETKVGPSVQDFIVFPRVDSPWMDKMIRRATGLQRAVSVPSDVEKRYQILSSRPIEVPACLLEYLRVQDGLRFIVASSSLLVERRILKGERLLREISDPESFRNALSDLESLVSLLSSP